MDESRWSNLEGRPWFGAHCRGEWWRCPAAAWRAVVKDADLLDCWRRFVSRLSFLSFQQAQVMFSSVFVSCWFFLSSGSYHNHSLSEVCWRVSLEDLWQIINYAMSVLCPEIYWNPLAVGWIWNPGVPRFSSFSTARVLSELVFSRGENEWMYKTEPCRGRQGKELFYLGQKWELEMRSVVLDLATTSQTIQGSKHMPESTIELLFDWLREKEILWHMDPCFNRLCLLRVLHVLCCN